MLGDKIIRAIIGCVAFLMLVSFTIGYIIARL